MQRHQAISNHSHYMRLGGLFVGCSVLAVLLVGLGVRQVRFRPEAERCEKEAIRWEKVELDLLDRIALERRVRAEVSEDDTPIQRWTHLAGRASEIARLYRSEAFRWRWGIESKEPRNYVRELWVDPE